MHLQISIMSLYHEAAEILNNARKSGGSLKSLVFGKKTWRSDAKALYALATETSKWSAVLSEVLERSLVLKVEKSVLLLPPVVLATHFVANLCPAVANAGFATGPRSVSQQEGYRSSCIPWP